ncbi:MAG: hypothetical protein WCD03_08885 [Candidatus Cybelea sp.]
MMRSLAVAGAIALALLPPVVALAAPPQAVVPVYHGSVPHPQAHYEAGRATERGVYRAPEINLHPRSLEPNAGTLYPSWHGISEPSRSYVLYQPPPWLQAGCLANNIFPSPASRDAYAPPQNVTIGSLVDGQSKDLFSATPSHRAGLASSADASAAAPTSGLSFQFQPSQCAPSSSLTF